MLVVICMLVNAVAIPVYLVIGYLIGGILLAPTTEEVTQQLDYLRIRRKSAVILANTQHQEGAVTTQQDGQEKKSPRPVLFKTFSKVDEGVLKRQQTTRQFMNQSVFIHSLDTDEAKQENRFDSFSNLRMDLVSQSNSFVGYQYDEFLDQWPIYSEKAMPALEEELQEVIKASEEWKKSLKDTPPATRGIRLLQLFVQDLIGRKSRQAKVFGNQLEEQHLEEKRVMSLGAKALAMTAIILMNLYFIFSCMLYGRRNGNIYSLFHPVIFLVL